VTTGLPVSIPVVIGTIDAWAEALSVDAHGVGDLMLMYGTTLFLVYTVPHRLTSPSLWGTVGALPGTRNLAGGTARSGAVTAWLRDLFGSRDYAELLGLADTADAGANGLLLLPYFAGEPTPVMDPEARGVVAGLTLSHTRVDCTGRSLRRPGPASATTSRPSRRPMETCGAWSRSAGAGCGRGSCPTCPSGPRSCAPSPSAPATAGPSWQRGS